MLKCPECECTETAKIVYSLPRPDDSGTDCGKARMDCGANLGVPMWECGACEHRWGRLERECPKCRGKSVAEFSYDPCDSPYGMVFDNAGIKNATDLSRSHGSQSPGAGIDLREGRCCIPPGTSSWKCNECHVTWGLLHKKCPECTSTMVAEMHHDHSETAARNDDAHAWECGECDHEWGRLERECPSCKSHDVAGGVPDEPYWYEPSAGQAGKTIAAPAGESAAALGSHAGQHAGGLILTGGVAFEGAPAWKCDSCGHEWGVACPECGGCSVAEIFYGLPANSWDWGKDVDSGKIGLGGCCIYEGSPKWECNMCGHNWGLY